MQTIFDNNEPKQMEEDRIEIEYFTDPLCCWSWAFEPQWRRFINEHKNQISWRYRMGGLIPDWKNYSDPLNDISRPAQMGPLWMQVKHLTGVEIDGNIWLEDPPQSSYPACIAVKCAGIQSQAAADILLNLLRKAVMTGKRNISNKSIISEIANEVETRYKALDYNKFIADFENNKGTALLKEDLQKVKLNDIGRFPTLTMQRTDGKGLIIVGYRPYHVLVEAFDSLKMVSTKQPI